MPLALRMILLFSLASAALEARAGAQQIEWLSASVRAALSAAVSDRPSPEPLFSSEAAKQAWLAQQTPKLARRLPDPVQRVELLKTIHYEAMRAGLDPHLVLGVIEVESAFRKYAISDAGAQGYMQVMPFWVRDIGRPTDNLFHLRTNLRYGCTILRYYLDREQGNLFRALGRYNGSVGKAGYPNAVLANWRKWTSGPGPMFVMEMAP
ncbi:MAG TPA: lytic transglycosylase domain-containing protein [Candidatus Competibacteraceae bacterium]|nr:lytic transglycosylase domain-containing protein [Candidatus Competibacteraceae bacterium]